ncbi:MAG: hypothetical protein K8M05_30005 [Deltaproteobacteria bacterium]|nr:hypothetical protein [Kofleriaceae bacterium]
MSWIVLVVGLVADAPAAGAERARSTGDELSRYVSSPRNDRAVRREVKRWHRTLTNGCVAYASTALRHLGVDIAEQGKLDGDGISRLTRGFSRHLEDHLGWRRVTDARALRPGDLVFTVDVVPEYPAHVFVFHGWVDRRRAIARISDNTGHRKPRPLFPPEGSSVDPFAYALRAP